jgi:flagellar FliL protein
MAEEEKREEEQESREEQVEEQPKRKKIPINLIITCIVGICLLGGGFFVWKSGMLSGLFYSEDSADLGDETTKKQMGPTYSMETFIVNLIGGRGKSYLKAKIELELDNEKLVVEIDKRLPQFRDAILTMLSSKTHDDIKTLEGKFQLRAEIISTLNQYLQTGKVLNVYFTDFIVQ